MNLSQPIHLIYAADGRFAMPLAVSLYSVLRRLRPDRSACVHIVDGGFTARQRRRIEQVARRGGGGRALTIEWVTPRREWWGGVQPDFSGKHLNETVLYRLGIPYFLPPEIDRAIYIDADVLAKKDLGDLEAQIDEVAGAAAVQDCCMPTWLRRYWGKREPLDRLGLSGEDPYFNAGVIGINVRYWREHEVAARAAAFLETHREIAGFYDQDALNHVLCGQWRALEPGWNFQPTCCDTMSRRGLTVEDVFDTTFEQLRADAKLIHYTGVKPWNQGFTNPERPFFVEELRASGWFTPVGQSLWAARWYGGLVRRGAERVWLYRIAPRLRRRTA